MRKRIKQLARGKFEYAKPVLSFSEEFVTFQAIEGRIYDGEFTIRSSGHIPVRGVVYTTEPRMECLTPQFEGEEVRIRYQFHTEGLVEGDSVKGEFVIVCNQCEYSLSFCANISKKYTETCIGEVKNLYDFTCLAKENWEEAYQLFYHNSFSNIIKSKEVKERMIYRGIIAAHPSYQNLEEFLIGIHKKNRIEIEIKDTRYEFSNIEETVQNTFEIKKSEWGFLQLEVEVDSEFLTVPKKTITTEDFLGSSYQFVYYIDAARLHAGVNMGRLFIRSAYQQITIEILVHMTKESKDNTNLQIKEYKVGMLELYQAYRLKRIVTGVWANETIEILNHLHALEPEEPMHLLMKAQALIINRQRQEAEWILEDFRKEWVDRKHPVWGYYIYVMTLLEREPTYVDRMTKEVEMIFHENPDSQLLFWVLTFLKEEYFNNSGRKLKAIEHWVMSGCTSPYLYLEAYYLIWQDPYLLTKLDRFEIRVLRWAIRQKAITKDISVQIFQILETSKEFDPVIYRILCAAYEANPKPENVGFICSYLIRGNQYDSKYHFWYERGIELELRITSLYEAYLLSMEDQQIVPIPRIIQMYFQYESALPYKKMAILYYNIIAAKKTCPEVYQKYQRTMGRFAMEQVEQEHMDDNLAVIYEDMLDVGLLNHDIAHHLSRILFTHKLVVFDPRMVRVIVYQRQMKEPQIIPITDQTCYFQLFSKEYVILFEDKEGKRYVSSVDYRLQNLMEPKDYVERCMELSKEDLPYIVWNFDGKKNCLAFTEGDKELFPKVIFSEHLSEEYKATILPEIVRYYQTCEYDGMIEEFLLSANFQQLEVLSRKYLLELYVENHLFEKAYELVHRYGIDQIGSASKVSLVTYMLKDHMEEEDDLLLRLCEQAFIAKKYNEVILRYLCSYYSGSSETMRQIWNAAQSYEIPSIELEERILSQVLYAGGELAPIHSVFLHYYENGGSELLVLAYLSVASYEYFVKGITISSQIFEIIEARYCYHLEVNDACKLALLRYLSEQNSVTKAQFAIEDELLAEFTCRNINFAFYKKLDRSLVMKYHLYDKIFLEYRTNPQNHVVLHYSRDEEGEEFLTEDMPDVYNGIFVKSFVMFFGDSIQYYITEEQGNQVEVTESSRLVNHDVYGEKDQSRYNLINQMVMSNTLVDEEALYSAMKKYAGYDEVTKQIFKIM